MADYTKIKSPASAGRYGDEPFGNNMVRKMRIETDSAGKLIDILETPAALAAADVIELAHLPAGFESHDALAVVSTAAGEALTLNIGFRYADGVDDASYPESDTAFFSALAVSAAARTRTTSAKEIKPLPKDAKLVAVAAGVTLASAMVATIALMGEQI